MLMSIEIPDNLAAEMEKRPSVYWDRLINNEIKKTIDAHHIMEYIKENLW